MNIFSSGSHIQRGGKDSTKNTTNKILGGYRIVSVHDQDGNEIFREKSQGPETLRTWFIIPEKETFEALELLCFMFESELLTAMNWLSTKCADQTIPVHVKVCSMMLDTKLIKYCTGLHGAHCCSCTASNDDMKNPDKIRDGNTVKSKI